MFIIIPLGGKGERFKKEKYEKPKALIPIFEKPILYYLLDNLDLKMIDFVYILQIEIVSYSYKQFYIKKILVIYNFIFVSTMFLSWRLHINQSFIEFISY